MYGQNELQREGFKCEKIAFFTINIQLAISENVSQYI